MNSTKPIITSALILLKNMQSYYPHTHKCVLEMKQQYNYKQKVFHYKSFFLKKTRLNIWILCTFCNNEIHHYHCFLVMIFRILHMLDMHICDMICICICLICIYVIWYMMYIYIQTHTASNTYIKKSILKYWQNLHSLWALFGHVFGWHWHSIFSYGRIRRWRFWNFSSNWNFNS